MTTSEEILGRIRRNRPHGDYPLPDIPRFALQQPGGLVDTFRKTLETMGGRSIAPAVDVGELQALKGRLAAAAIVCSATDEVHGNRELASIREPRDLADVDIAVVRAVLGVAETGSVLFTEEQLRVNTIGYLAQHLVVLLDPAAIVPGLQDAYDAGDFHRSRYAVFHTGPSATGDIEGVLIHGAQGVRSLTVVLASIGQSDLTY
jgi:L-lactate dehydrogenase complex protein LldG